MVKRRVRLIFSSEAIAEPITYNLGQQFRLITNIRQANLTEDRGWLILDLEGEEKDIEAGIEWAISRGVLIHPVNSEESTL